MKSVLLLVLFLLVGSTAMAAEDEARLEAQMKKMCASLFVDGAPCANLAKGSRKCVRQNAANAAPPCNAFLGPNRAFLDAGMDEEIIKK